MNPRFETINDTLCIILEKPIPLCASIKYPYVISGKKTKHPSIVTQDMDALLRIFIIAYSDEFEVIGYPVEEGSHWWALWQMQNGKAVCHTKAPSIKYSMPTHYVKRRVRENSTDDMSIEVWLSGADEFGWQLYEPKPEPLLADARKGDLCQRRDGKWVRLSDVIGNSVFKYPNPESNDEICQFICDETGDTKPWGKIDEADIIHTEPLAPEGTAEWAWQMLMLNKKVWHPAEQSMETTALPKDRFVDCHAKVGWQLYEPKPKLCPTCNGTGFVSYDDMDGITTQSCSCHHISEHPQKHLLSNARSGDSVRLRNGEVHKLIIRKNNTNLGHDYWAGDIQRSHDIDGCYLLSKEEHRFDIVELLPELNVGDWVRSDEGDGVIEDIPLTMPDVRMTDGRLLSFHAEDLKAIKPSEVVVDFGCGIKGTIHHDKESWGFVVLDEHNDWIAQIEPDNLSEPMKSLVESLLKAQEEE